MRISDTINPVYFPLIGSAPRVAVWFMLECPTVGQDKQYIPDSALSHLMRQIRQVHHARLLFIHQGENKPLLSPEFYIGLVTEEHPRLFRIPLKNYSDLLKIDINGFVNNSHRYRNYLYETPLFVLFNHYNASEDLQVKYLYEQFEQDQKIKVWQSASTKLNRFLPDLLAFPSGMYYSHLTGDDVKPMSDSSLNRKIYNRKAQGRSCHDPIVQAAEYFLRQSIGCDEKPLKLQSLQEMNKGIWQVCLSQSHLATSYRVCIRRSVSSHPFRNQSDLNTSTHVYHLIGCDIMREYPF